jgi:hypothetical protein
MQCHAYEMTTLDTIQDIPVNLSGLDQLRLERGLKLETRGVILSATIFPLPTPEPIQATLEDDDIGASYIPTRDLTRPISWPRRSYCRA